MFFNLAQSLDRDESWLKDNADMLDQGMLLSSNTAILASELFRSIPLAVSRVAKTAKSFTGVLSIPFQMRDLWKVEADFTLAARHWDWSGLLYTTVKVALKATEIFLTLGYFTVYSLSLAGFPGLAPVYFNAVTPIAVASWFTLIAFDIIDHFQNQTLLHELEEIVDKQEIAAAFEAMVQGKCEVDHPLARRLLRQFDSYRLDSLTKEGISFTTLHENLKTSILLNNANILLKIFGYICLGINKMYPETLIQALTEWSASLLYTAKLAYSKYHLNNKFKQSLY